MRIAIAAVGGLVGLALYIMAAVALGDVAVGAHWALQAIYYLIAGLAWVAPVRWLMFWAAGMR